MGSTIDGPNGPLAVPHGLEDPSRVDGVSLHHRGTEVELIFHQARLASDDDATTGEVVARLFMARRNFNQMVDWMCDTRDRRERLLGEA